MTEPWPEYESVPSEPADAVRESRSPAAPPEVLAEWDARLQRLWDSSLETALEAAGQLYAPDVYLPEAGEEDALPWLTELLTTTFWRTLMDMHGLPDSPLARYESAVAAVEYVLHMMRHFPPNTPFVEERLAVALRPVRRLRAGMMTAEVCATLYDYHRGIWKPHLTKPQLWIIRTALAQTIAALPPDAMDVFWEQLQSPVPMVRQAMLLGLEDLRDAHAVPHLLRGLEQSHDHDTRHAIVDCLEQIGDPRAIAGLTHLRRDTAYSDWTLSRHIQRAIRVIELHNRGRHHRQLLRASEMPPENDRMLVHPTESPATGGEETDLLRPAVSGKPQESNSGEPS